KKIAFRSGPRGGALTVNGGGSAWPYQIAQAQGPIDVRFTLDSDVYCARFVSFRRNQAGRVSATDASAPPDCADPPPPTCGDGVQGLFSVAFHPDFETNGFIYVNYTSKPSGTIADGDTVVERYHASPTSDQADPLSAQLVFTVHQPFSNHNGGLNLFGPDGMLYVGMGDGGSGGDPLGNGQSNSSHLGKLLRFDVSTLPATPQHFAKGLRNRGRYFYSDVCSGFIRSLSSGDPGTAQDHTAELFPAGTLNVSSFGLDARGELYVVHHGGGSDGAVYEIVPRPFSCGDVKGDGVVDIGDALLIAQFDVGARSCSAIPYPALCDVTRDGACNI